MASSYCGDNEFESFLSMWDYVLAGMHEGPPEETLRVHFYRQVRNSNVIKFDLEVYNRSSLGDDTYTYAYLRKVTTCYLNMLKVEANRRCI